MPQIAGNVPPEGRLRWLQDRLTSAGSITIAATAAELDVSEMTVRRDLQELEARGVARRVRGGAVPVGPQGFAERHRTRARAKTLIATKVLRLLPPSGAIAMDASSTVLRVATALAGGQGLLVLTNGPDAFAALQGRSGIRPLLTGGELESSTGSLVGDFACRAVRQLALTHVVASAAALDPVLGATEATLAEAEVKRAMAEDATEVILAVDASKLGNRALAVGIDWDHVHTIVTDLDPTDARLDPYRGRAAIV